MTLIKGILKNASGVRPNTKIILIAQKTTSSVLNYAPDLTIITDANGAYSFECNPSTYLVVIMQTGNAREQVGTIQVYSDSPDGSLNDFFTMLDPDDATPEIIKELELLRNHARESADRAEAAANNAANDAADEFSQQFQDRFNTLAPVKWTPNTEIKENQSLQVFEHDGLFYLPNVKKLPFTTGAVFNVDNWFLSQLLTPKTPFVAESAIAPLSINERLRDNLNYKDFGLSSDPSQLDNCTVLGHFGVDVNVKGSAQGFEYDNKNQRAFISGFVTTDNVENVCLHELTIDDNGAPTGIKRSRFNLGVGHGETVMIDDDTVYFAADGFVKRVKWLNDGVDYTVETLTIPAYFFSWYDVEGGDVRLAAGGGKVGLDYIIPIADFRNDNLAPRLIINRDSHVSDLNVVIAMQSYKSRYGVKYSVNGFDASTHNAAIAWARMNYVATDNGITLKLEANIDDKVEPENISWFVKDGKAKTVVMCLGNKSYSFLQCSNNVVTNRDLMMSGKSKVIPNNDLFTRNYGWDAHFNPVAAMAVGIGCGYISQADGDHFEDFYLTQEANNATKSTAAICHDRAKHRIMFHAPKQKGDGWADNSHGWRYYIPNAEDQGELGKYPISVTKDNVSIGKATSSAEVASLLVASKSTSKAAVYADGAISFAGVNYNTTGSALTLGKVAYQSGGYTDFDKTDWYWMNYNHFQCVVDNYGNLGGASKRWKELFVANPVINTSDIRLKKFFDIDDTEKKAALEIKSIIKKFKWNSAVDEKGGEARYHFGVGAQHVRDILLKNGLKPEQYAFLTHDKWDDEFNEDGSLRISAGDLWGIRYGELAVFILAAI